MNTIPLVIAAIDDDQQQLDHLSTCLGSEFSVHPHRLASTLLRAMGTERFDAYVIDVHMPVQDGFSVAHQIMASEHYRGEPFLFITFDQGRDTIERCLREIGADYVHRSVQQDEIAARINRLVKKRRSRSTSLGSLEVDSETVSVSANGELIDLTLKEYKIISFLLARHNHVVHRDHLQRHVWGETQVSDKTLNSHLTNLRAKIASAGVTVQIDRRGVVEALEKN